MTVKVTVLAAAPGAQLRWIPSLPGIITGEDSFARRISEKAGPHPASTFTAKSALASSLPIARRLTGALAANGRPAAWSARQG